MRNWNIEIGEESTREEISQRFGGATQGGILSSAQTPNIFVYMDPAVAEIHGYNYDGWVEENKVFQYTGDGQIGDQRMIRGNKMIRDHQITNKALRVFTANGIKPETTKMKRQLYIGQFFLDPDYPCFMAEAPDKNRDLRTVFVFRLRPMDEALVRETERCSTLPPPERTTVEKVNIESWSEETDIEESHAPTFLRGPVESLTAQRRESDLVQRYKSHLESNGHKVIALNLNVEGSARPLRVDLFDNTSGELCEAKSSATRDRIRHAIGQLFDYSRHVKEYKTRSILVPNRPEPDLIKLLAELDIACVYETSPNSFRRTDTE